MKPARFKYFDPESLDDAVHLRSSTEDSRPLAGGQSLMPMMNFRFVQPATVIDLNRVCDLQLLNVAGDVISFGAMARQREILENAQIKQEAPIFSEALKHVGHRQTRARGTIGGSLSHFDPSAELCNLAALHDTRFKLSRRGGTRELAFNQFGLGYLTTAIEPDELLVSMEMKRWPAGHGWAFEEFAFRHGDFALCAVSCLMRTNQVGALEEIALCVSGLQPIPMRFHEFEASAIGVVPDEAFCREAAHAAGQMDAMSDAYVSSAYRKHLARVLTHRCVARASGQIGLRQS